MKGIIAGLLVVGVCALFFCKYAIDKIMILPKKRVKAKVVHKQEDIKKRKSYYTVVIALPNEELISLTITAFFVGDVPGSVYDVLQIGKDYDITYVTSDAGVNYLVSLELDNSSEDDEQNS